LRHGILDSKFGVLNRHSLNIEDSGGHFLRNWVEWVVSN
jgi:hypothetical protein